MNTRKNTILLSILFLGGLLTFELVPSWQEPMFIYGTFWFMLGLVLIWLHTLITYAYQWQILSKHVYTHRYAIGLVFIGAIILTTSIPFELRVLADESNLISTSRSLLDHKAFQNSISGTFYYENYNTTHTALPIRPPMFPFLLSIIHSLLGYAPENAGWINLGAWIGLVYILYLNLYIHTKYAYSIIPLLLSIPILSLCARSGGFDILSVFFLILIFHTLRRIDEEPNDDRFWMLWSYLLFFIHTRYENIILLMIILPYLFYKHRIHEHKKGSLWMAAGIFFMLPKWFQMRFARGQYENEEEALLSLSHLYTHTASFLDSLVDMSLTIPYNNTLNILGMLGGVLLLWDISQKKYSSRITLELVCSGLITCIFFAHFLGNPQNQTSLRFFLILNITLALLTLYTLHRLRFRPAGIIVFSWAMFCIYHPISVRNEYMNALLYPREAHIVYQYLQPFRSSNTLVLVDMPGAFVVYDVGAFSIEYANLNIEELHKEFHRHLYERIIVVQRILHETQQPIADDMLNERVQLLPIITHQTSDEYFLRISEVLNIEQTEQTQ